MTPLLPITYIDDTVVSGRDYGFTIGSTKQEAYKDIIDVKKQFPKLMIYIDYGPRAGDNFTLEPTNDNFIQIIKHEDWNLLLDGDGEFFNIIRLKFSKDKLNEIYRHRKYFEGP